jgi:hypothetical protein
VVAFVNGSPISPIVLGFIYSEDSALFFDQGKLVREAPGTGQEIEITKGFRLERHTSGWYWLADKLGHYEWHHPSGLKVKVGPDELFLDLPDFALENEDGEKISRGFPTDADTADQYGASTPKVIRIQHQAFTLRILDSKVIEFTPQGDVQVPTTEKVQIGDQGSQAAVGRVGDAVRVQLTAADVASLGLEAGGDPVTAPAPATFVDVDGTIIEGSGSLEAGD